MHALQGMYRFWKEVIQVSTYKELYKGSESLRQLYQLSLVTEIMFNLPVINNYFACSMLYFKTQNYCISFKHVLHLQNF